MGRLASGQSSSGPHSFSSSCSGVRAAHCSKPQQCTTVGASGWTDDKVAIDAPVKRPKTWGFELSEDTIDASQESASGDDVFVGHRAAVSCKGARKQRKPHQLGKSLPKSTTSGTTRSRQVTTSDKEKHGSSTLDRWFRKVPVSSESGGSKCLTQDGFVVADVSTKRSPPSGSPRGGAQRPRIRSGTSNALEAAPSHVQTRPGRTRSPSETPEARPSRGKATSPEVEGQGDGSCCSAQTPPRTPTPADSSRRALIRQFCATMAATRASAQLSVESTPSSKPTDVLCAAADATDSKKQRKTQEANDTAHQPAWRPRFGITS
mmetsp:Transcript_139281/g.277728  ORF Transcript_139281/g.277728 Transcript_139281/m.277728 type:complete len:320 (+) Transcript_139281:48-1007(+)